MSSSIGVAHGVVESEAAEFWTHCECCVLYSGGGPGAEWPALAGGDNTRAGE